MADSSRRVREMRQRLKPTHDTENMPAVVTTTTEEDGSQGGATEPLSPGDRMFHDHDFNVHVLAILGCKSKVDIHIVTQNFPTTLLRHPRFSSIVVGDASKGEELRWVRIPNVNPMDHIIIPADIDDVAAEVDPDKYVEDYVYNLSKTRLDRSKPLWEIHILNLKTSQAESTVIFRIHHSLGDGTSLMSLLLACTRQIADPTKVPTVPASRTNRRKTEMRRRQWWWWRWMMAVWLVVEMCWNTVVDVAVFMATAAGFLKDTETALKGKEGVANTPRRVVFRSVSLDDMKLLKDAVNGTINDAALGITQAGLSIYLNRKYGGDEKKNNLPKNVRLRSALLINLRPSAGIQALADMMEKNTKAKWGNWIGYVLLPFTIKLRDDPLDYLRQAKAIVERKKRSFEAIATFAISEIALKLFGSKISGEMSHRVAANMTMAFSNLVGPMEEIGFYGHALQFLAPSSYGQPYALMINFQSYVDKMMIVLSVDEDTIPDASQLCEDIVESLRLIKEAIIAKGLS